MKSQLTEAVHQLVKRIPPGRATSYGAIARAIGYPNHSRLVGRIMGQCGLCNEDIPAHRVVNSQGLLSGKECFPSPTLMQELLEAEGVQIKNDRIRNWKQVFWNPIDEIEFEE